MSTTDFARPPAASEYDPFYVTYVSKVPAGDVLEVLRHQLASSLDLFRSIPDSLTDHRYAAGKWTVRQVIGHVVDAERVFSYRAASIARGDTTPLPGMDQNVWMAGARFEQRTLASLIDEYQHLRLANLALFSGFDDQLLDRSGTASDSPITVRALVFVIAGHERHHVAVLRERYL